MYRLLAVISLLVVSIGFIYAPSFSFGYIDWDDPVYVVTNPAIEGVTLKNVQWAFTTNWAYNWHPLTWVSYMVDVQLFGRRPEAFHTVNVALHAINTVLLLLLMRAMTGEFWKGAFVAAVFAVHPLHVESVVWISERKDVLSLLFGLASMLAYVAYTRRERGWLKWYVASIIAFACSLLAKQTLVTLPFLLLVLDWWPLKRTQQQVQSAQEGTGSPQDEEAGSPDQEEAGSPTAEEVVSPGDVSEHVTTVGKSRWKKLVLEKTPFLILSLAFSIIVYVAQRPNQDIPEYAIYPLWVRCLNAVLSYGLYLKKSIWPYDLAAFYPHPGSNISLVAVAGSALLLLAVTVAAVLLRKRYPAVLVGWLWYLGTLVPMIGIVQVGEQQIADRYMYIPLIGLTMMVAWFVPAVVPAGPLRSRLLPAAAVLLVCVLTLGASVQSSYWHDGLTLFQRTVDVTTDNHIAHNSLGTAYWSEGLSTEARAEYEKAVAIRADYADAHQNLANLSRESGDVLGAEQHYKAALESKPDDPALLNEYGEFLLSQRRLEDALPTLQRAVDLAAYFPEAHNNYGQALAAAGRDTDALSEFAKALLINPNFIAAHCNMAMVLLREGHFEEALVSVDAARKLAPDHPPAKMLGFTAHLELGRKLAAANDHRTAVSHFEQAALLAGSQYDAHLCQLLMAQSLATWDEAAARSHYEQAIQLAPQSATAWLELGKLLLAAGERDAAIEHLEQALRYSPDDPLVQEALRQAKEGQTENPNPPK